MTLTRPNLIWNFAAYVFIQLTAAQLVCCSIGQDDCTLLAETRQKFGTTAILIKATEQLVTLLRWQQPTCSINDQTTHRLHTTPFRQQKQNQIIINTFPIYFQSTLTLSSLHSFLQIWQYQHTLAPLVSHENLQTFLSRRSFCKRFPTYFYTKQFHRTTA